VSNKLPEDMVYTITTGFYPELFSGEPKWKAQRGKGRKGMQWLKTRGFSKASIKKIGGKRIEGKGKYQAFLTAVRDGNWKDAYSGLDEDTKKGVDDRILEDDIQSTKKFSDKKTGNFSQANMEANMNYYKFMGGGEQYKLWGSKVWWQHGGMFRQDGRGGEKMESALNEWQENSRENDLGTYLESLYVKKERYFWKMARKLAEDVFETAIDEDNLRTDLESVGKEAHVPEEERKEASREAKGESQKVNSIGKDWHNISKARGLDIKYRLDENTTIFMDATEMPLNEAGSHGIVKSVQKDLRVAIAAAKDKGKGWKVDLKKAVIKMFEASIRLYNKDIEAIMKTGEEAGHGTKGKETIKELFKDIKKERKDAGHKDPRVSVASLAKKTGLDQIRDKAEKAQQETTLSYVVHMIVNLAGDANANYRQGHLIGRMYGRNTYASVGMQLKERNGIPSFNTAYMKRNTHILQGESHLIAYQQSIKHLQSGKAKETQARQIQAFSNGKIMGAGRVNSGSNHRASANMGIFHETRPTTRVTFHPKSMDRLLLKQIPDLIGKNTDGGEIETKFKDSMRNKRAHKLKNHDNGAKFWAMPYIGLMEYPQKAKVSATDTKKMNKQR